MIWKPWKTNKVSRRLFLGGAGAMLALPLMESSLPRALRAAGTGPTPGGPPKRLAFYYIPNGIHMAGWTPATTGANWATTPILSPLEARGVKSDVLVLSGLDNTPGKPDGAGDHAGGTGAFLTCHKVIKTAGDYENAISVDQVAANAWEGSSSFKSLQLGLEGGSSIGDCDSGYSCAYARNISWAGPKTPMPKVTSPRVVFELMFGGADPAATAAELEQRKSFRLSLLDYVNTDATKLRTKLGHTDRIKLDQYLNGIRELEIRVEEAEAVPSCDVPVKPTDDIDITQAMDIMTDLMARAIQCDMTRVMTFMMANAGSNRNYDFLGVSGAHHNLSHHQNDPETHAKLTTINTWEVDQFAKLVERLKSMPEDDGSTVLDNTWLFFGSEIEDGDAHRHTDMPILLAGGAGGIPSGRHLDLNGGKVSELFISMLCGVGVPTTSFGDDGAQELAGFA